MKAEIKSRPTIKLELTLQEAKWLKAIVQNPLCDNESQNDSTLRERLFTCLHKLEGV